MTARRYEISLRVLKNVASERSERVKSCSPVPGVVCEVIYETRKTVFDHIPNPEKKRCVTEYFDELHGVWKRSNTVSSVRYKQVSKPPSRLRFSLFKLGELF